MAISETAPAAVVVSMPPVSVYPVPRTTPWVDKAVTVATEGVTPVGIVLSGVFLVWSTIKTPKQVPKAIPLLTLELLTVSAKLC